MFFLGHISDQLGWTPWVEGILFSFVIWFLPIHNIMSHPLGVSYSSGGECESCCLGGHFYISNTLYMCTIPQQHCGISLLHEQGHNAEVLRKRIASFGFRVCYIERIFLD